MFVKGYVQTRSHRKRIGDANRGKHLGSTADGVQVVRNGEKLCLTCNLWQPFSAFHSRPDRPVGLRAKCKSCEKIYRRSSPKSRKLTEYRSGAKSRGLSFDLTREQFLAYWEVPCTYCGDQISTIGIDRIDPSKGYSEDNVVSCCATCNVMKMAMNREVFIKHCHKVTKKSQGL